MKILLLANVIAAVVVIVTAAMLAWTNAGSRNLALATGTLGAALVLFVIQLPFELRRQTLPTEYVHLELTVDRAKPQIRQWVYDPECGDRLIAEVYASDWLASINPKQFEEDRQLLSRDLAFFSVVSFFLKSMPDWQMVRRTYKGRSVTRRTVGAGSQAGDFVGIPVQRLRIQLSQAGNVFSGAPFQTLTEEWRLPPGTTQPIAPRAAFPLIADRPVRPKPGRREERETDNDVVLRRGLHIEDGNGRPWRSPELAAQVLERKFAYAFASRGAGAVEWAWNINPYMPIDNESVIGFFRPDGTAKPELDVVPRFAKFFREAAPWLDDFAPDPVVIVIPQSRLFMNRPAAIDGFRRIVRVLAERFGIVPTALSDLRLTAERLRNARLVIVPSVELRT